MALSHAALRWSCTPLTGSTELLRRCDSVHANQKRLSRTAVTCCMKPSVRLTAAHQRKSFPLSTSVPFSRVREQQSACLCPSAAGRQDADVLIARASAASSDAAAGGEENSVGGIVKTIQLGSLFGMWYLFNIGFNIYNKQVLKVFPYPITLTVLQFTVGSLIVPLMWLTGLHKPPKVSKEQLLAILPLAAVHTLGNLFTNMSLGKVAVSFTHTIKALEPFFSVLLSALFLGDKPTPLIIASLVPIMGGVALASATEASFNWAGFLSAMASNLTFQSRNVLSKKLMVKKDGSLDNINLFSIITIISFFLLLPAMFIFEGVKFTPSFLQAKGLDVQQTLVRMLITGVCFHSYQQVSYMILQQVSPVTHSVGNCVKRVVVIVTSVLFFRSPVSTVNAIGTAIALSGVFAYSRVKSLKPKKA